jgi:hypothetical protein
VSSGYPRHTRARDATNADWGPMTSQAPPPAPPLLGSLINRQSLAAANDVCGLCRRKLRRVSAAVATSREGHRSQ